MDIEEQKVVATEALRRIKDCIKHSYIVGGAIRNWLLDRPAKDIDFYVKPKADFSYEDMCSLLSSAGLCDFYLVGAVGNPEKYPTRVINYVLEGVFEEMPIQVIVLKEMLSPERAVESFPIDISRVWATYYNDELLMGVSKECQHAFNSKHITVLHKPECIKDITYIRKIQGYFPDWEFVCQYDLDKMEKEFTDQKTKKIYKEDHCLAVTDLPFLFGTDPTTNVVTPTVEF